MFTKTERLRVYSKRSLLVYDVAGSGHSLSSTLRPFDCRKVVEFPSRSRHFGFQILDYWGAGMLMIILVDDMYAASTHEPSMIEHSTRIILLSMLVSSFLSPRLVLTT